MSRVPVPTPGVEEGGGTEGGSNPGLDTIRERSFRRLPVSETEGSIIPSVWNLVSVRKRGSSK